MDYDHSCKIVNQRSLELFLDVFKLPRTSNDASVGDSLGWNRGISPIVAFQYHGYGWISHGRWWMLSVGRNGCGQGADKISINHSANNIRGRIFVRPGS